MVIFIAVAFISCAEKTNKKDINMNARETIKQYYNAFKEADKEALRETLTEDFKHISSYAVYENRDKMIQDIWPAVGKTWAVNLEIFGTHPEFMVRYNIEGADQPSQNMAEYIRFEDDKIAEIEVFMGRELD